MSYNSEVAQAILHALVYGEGYIKNENNISVPKLTLNEQKKFLKRYADLLDFDNKKSLGKIIKGYDKNALKFCNEGTIINLDKLDKSIIKQMYEFVYYVINE